mmetsp:Transcript_14652/g.37429  ORF Transcript_14652/g.37429 Transcript_14652/m.37429 type:complete len:345 (+) Transcript_14652:216-1250(+)
MGNLCGGFSRRDRKEESSVPLVDAENHLRSLSVFDPSGAPRSLIAGHTAIPSSLGEFKGNGADSIGVGFESLTGHYPSNPQWMNQDNYGVFVPFGDDENVSLYCVFDGHGPYGGTASAMAREKIVEYLERNYERLLSEPKVVFSEAFIRTNEEMINEEHGDHFEFSGTTAVCVLLIGNKIICANAGDSRAVLAKVRGGRVDAVDLSDDHKPSRNDERKRIRANGGRIFPLDPQVDPTLRVWTKSGDYPGVAFTRSIGDAVADSLGCFGEPEFTELTATNEDGFIVIASDGVWEFMTSQLVVELVAPFADAKEAARKLCNEAKKRWLSLEVGCVQKHEGTLQLSQ